MFTSSSFQVYFRAHSPCRGSRHLHKKKKLDLVFDQLKSIIGPWLRGALRTGCRTVGLLGVLLPILETLEHPACLTFEQVTVLIFLDRKDPATSDKVPDLQLTHIAKLEDIIIELRLALGLFGC